MPYLGSTNFGRIGHDERVVFAIGGFGQRLRLVDRRPELREALLYAVDMVSSTRKTERMA